MIEKSFKYLFLFVLVLFQGVPESFAQNVNDIRFPVENWSEELLAVIDAGPQYLPESMDVHVEPPPANDSVQTKYELSRLREYKNLRTEDVRNLILYENDPALGFPEFFADVVDWEQGEYRLTKDLINIFVGEVSFFVLREKQKFQRPRPNQLADDLDNVIENPAHAAYPSAHATQMYIMALLLSTLDPQGKEMYTNKAFDIAGRREIAGVHYPSDTVAGFKLAAVVFEELLKQDYIKILLPMAKEEFSAGR